MQRLLFLDSLRFVAALMVVLYHYSHRGGLKYTSFRMESIDSVTRYGYLGVELFFIISGFVIFYSIKKSKNFIDFSIKRFLRLWPSLAFAAVLTFLAIQIFGFTETPGFLTLGCNLAAPLILCEIGGLGYVDGVYWSLALEVVFYAIIAFMILTKINTNETYTKVAMALWLVVSSALIFLDLGSGKIKTLLEIVFISNYAAYFITGICLYKIWDGNSRSKGYHLILLVSTIISSVHAYSVALKMSQDNNITYVPWIASTISALFSLIILMYSHKAFELKNPLYVYLGALTYPLYLIHQNIGYIIINYISELYTNDWIILILPILVSLALSVILLNTSETWSKNLSKWYSRRTKKSLPTSDRSDLTAP